MVLFGKRFRASILMLIACATMISSQAAMAAGPPLLSTIHQFRLSNFSALNSYYRFSANSDTSTLNDIVASINSANAEIKKLSDEAEGILNKDQVTRLTEDFDKYKDLMRQNINDVRKNGYPDLRLVSDMANQAQALSSTSEELYQIILSHDDVHPDKRVEAARSASILMAQMMSKYSARSTSSVSQTFQGADTEIPLDEQAKAFDKLMSDVTSGNPSGELRSALSGVASKWGFIRSSYVNYNEKNVSFVIDRYSNGILSGLADAIAVMTSTSGDSAAQASVN